MGADALSLPFQEAIDFLRNKLDVPTATWTDIREAMHARAFVVAGAIKSQLIADFHDAVNRAIAGGRTLDDFRRDFDAIVAMHGWDYNGSRNWRSAVIYNTNMRMAVAAGRWAQGMRLADGGGKVYIRYTVILDSRTRPLHREWGTAAGQGIILPVDHPFWDTHYPPNGWECRCSVQFLTEEELAHYGWEVTKDEDIPAILWQQRQLNTPDGVETVSVPEGIDTGFGYNVGKAAWGRGADRAAIEQHGPWRELKVPAGIRQSETPLDPAPTDIRPAPPAPRDGGAGTPGGIGTAPTEVSQETVDALRSGLREALGGDEAILTDPAGEAISVGQAIVDHMIDKPSRIDGRERYFPFIPDLIQAPQEIWIGFAEDDRTGLVSLRRRYVKFYRIGKDQVLGLVTDADGNRWSGLTFFRGSVTALKKLRTGLRVYGDDGRETVGE